MQKNNSNPSPLILGGHSFITQLGNDPAADFDIQLKIVNTCLDNNITTFDTTYQPERIALGNILSQLGRRNEATLIAWNFFTDFNPNQDVGPADYYQPHHLQIILDQLQTNNIDMLVVHRIGNSPENDRQEQLAFDWQSQGAVNQLGVWNPSNSPATEYQFHDKYCFMVRPNNTARIAGAPPAFAAAKAIGWQTFACSPFTRGWNLDKIIENAAEQTGKSQIDLRPKIADLMIRFALYQPNIDRLITAIRNPKWVAANIESVKRGPLTEKQTQWLLSMQPNPDP